MAALDREREDVRSLLKQLGIELAALDVGAGREASAPRCSLASSLTSTEKVALFRSLFRGRDDIYPKLWENSRTGKKGYAPACANEWVRGVCEKPRVSCGECPNQAFLTVTDQVIVDHLQGRHVIGVYALLESETCWFLAVDFDKQSWMEDAGAFVQTCRTARIPVAVERSRSGNGAHAWCFFAAPVPAVSFERVLSNVKATYVTGLTATLQRRDGHHPIIEMQLGPVRFTIDSKNQTARQPFAHRLIVRETQFRLAGDAHQTPIQDLYRALVADESRNQFIVNDVLNALEEGRSPILLTERRDHLEYFEAQLRPAARNLVVLRGGIGAKQRREVTERIAAIPPDEERLVLATGRYIGEGFDDAQLDTLFLTLPVSWKGTLVQDAGRLHRLHAGKQEVRIFDYADREVPMLARMFEKRLRGYRAIGYEQRELPDGYEGVSDEPIIEWDEGALRTFNDPI